jgi:hypothetical protein
MNYSTFTVPAKKAQKLLTESLSLLIEEMTILENLSVTATKSNEILFYHVVCSNKKLRFDINQALMLIKQISEF